MPGFPLGPRPLAVLLDFTKVEKGQKLACAFACLNQLVNHGARVQVLALLLSC